MGKKVPSLDVVEVLLVQCSLVDNQQHQKSDVLYTFMPNKSCAYLLNVEPNTFVIYDFIKTFTDQNDNPLETKDI